MKKINQIITIATMATSLVGCASGPMLGSVTKLNSDKEVEIFVGKAKMKAGDRVVFFAEDCTVSGIGRSARRQCTKERRGEAQIVRIGENGMALVSSEEPMDLTRGYIKAERVMSHTESITE